MACALLAGCGRIGYDEHDDGGSGGLTLSYPSNDVAAVVGVTALALTPTVSRDVEGFDISPALPSGVSLDASSGVVSGTPAQSADAVFTVTAHDGADSARFDLRLTALPGYVADVTADFPDDDGGSDPTCFATPAGGCTLRAAVQTVNRRSGRQLVLLIAGDYALGSGLEPVDNDFVIAGQGIDETLVRPSAPRPGFGMLQLGTARTLGLRRASFHDFGMHDGAVVQVTAGTLEVDASRFVNNASAGSGGVFFIAGGARATIRTSIFTGNESFGGCCGGWGGVIHSEDQGSATVVSGCTATGNRSAWGSFSHISAGTTLRLESSTLYGNESTTAGTLASPGGVYTLVHDTIAYNTNTNGGQSTAGLYLHSLPVHYVIANTLVAFNTDVTGAQFNCYRNDTGASLTSEGGNLFGDGGDNCAAYFTAPGDRLDVDPGLAAGGPTDHGGPTPTILLRPGTPAIDGALTARCPPTDQRGLPRPAGGDAPLCDVGAVEMQ